MVSKDGSDIKRKAWLCVFIGSGLFWLLIAAVIYWLLN
ncbi:YmiA family putative membrane protein [Serratia nevei]|nr:YmiA family putative membrane protein [Serratia marcescens]MBL0874237.1 YmiA family putative membrane protein [Serratia nevei]MBH1893920.1 YmiA family putative membrane protein [Serratia marcescens]MBI6143626.1 YmiA family putative membrane protein [Serratia marcescens]MBN5383066.1 YmiA family putative membrane protein [Serratia marcescens]MBN5408328.1 YmiA family putative membrane protein [Serratia marcescens]